MDIYNFIKDAKMTLKQHKQLFFSLHNLKS